MSRYFIEMSFKGTPYHGWQSQPNALSVQEEIEKALRILTHEDIRTVGAGRTDTGVHARYFVAHFDSESDLPASRMDFVYKMNALLPLEIALLNIYPVNNEAHARYSALSRTYQYTISRVKDPFNTEYAWYYSLPLNIAAMNKAAERLTEFDDFTSFSKLHSDVQNNICRIFEAGWKEYGTHLVFNIRGNRFLRNMVRSIVGTMIDIGRGKIDLEGFNRIVAGKNRNLGGFSVPAQGLMLYHIQYDDTIK